MASFNGLHYYYLKLCISRRGKKKFFSRIIRNDSEVFPYDEIDERLNSVIAPGTRVHILNVIKLSKQHYEVCWGLRAAAWI